MSERLRYRPPEEESRPLPKTADFRYAYRGYYDDGGICRVRLFAEERRLPVILVSHLEENRNTSITIWRNTSLRRSARSNFPSGSSRPVLPFSAPVARRCAELRHQLKQQGRRVTSRAMDLIIAATALDDGLALVTRNTSDDDDVPGLTVYRR